MKIHWSISKKVGMHRPTLKYSCHLEDWERELNVRHDDSQVSIRCPSFNGSIGLSKTGVWEDDESHDCDMSLPNPRYNPSYKQSVVLPWRASGEYPEVEKAFEALQAEWERRVAIAIASKAIEVSGVVHPTAEYKRLVAPHVAKIKLSGE